jgi:predicted ATP-dependent endonuclease of OLD family
MMIEEIHLVSFKGFRDFTLKCAPVTVLVGLNSSGKTSILQSIQLVDDIVRYAFGGWNGVAVERPNFSNVQW